MTPTDRLLEAVQQLTEPREHSEAYTRIKGAVETDDGQWVGGYPVNDRWNVWTPSLLAQLTEALPGGSTDSTHGVPDSRPQAHIDALDTLMEIDNDSTKWLSEHGGSDRGTIVANLHAMVGVAVGYGSDSPELREVARMAWAWRTRACVITGWEVAAWSPANSCPLCGELGGLRVRMDVGLGTGTGFCIKCRETWDEDTIGILAAHIQWESDQPGVGVAGTHRTRVEALVTNADCDEPAHLADMRWLSSCYGCRWQWNGLVKSDALLMARLHRKLASPVQHEELSA